MALLAVRHCLLLLAVGHCLLVLAVRHCLLLLAVGHCLLWPAAAGEDWEEVGEEVPFHTESAPGRSRRRGAAVPAGDYFTVVKGSPCLEMSHGQSWHKHRTC